MPRPPASDGPGTRERLLSVAHAHLVARGYHGLSLHDIAAEVGIRKASLYHHYPGGKDHLVADALAHALGRIGDAFDAAIAVEETTRGRLVAVARWMRTQDAATARVLRDASGRVPEADIARLAGLFVERMVRPLRRVIDDGVARGELRPHDAELSSALCLGLLTDLAEVPGLQGRPHLEEDVVDLFLRGVGA